jgi:hypothetical protein
VFGSGTGAGSEFGWVSGLKAKMVHKEGKKEEEISCLKCFLEGRFLHQGSERLWELLRRNLLRFLSKFLSTVNFTFSLGLYPESAKSWIRIYKTILKKVLRIQICWIHMFLGLPKNEKP